MLMHYRDVGLTVVTGIYFVSHKKMKDFLLIEHISLVCLKMFLNFYIFYLGFKGRSLSKLKPNQRQPGKRIKQFSNQFSNQ